jgi:chromate transporter
VKNEHFIALIAVFVPFSMLSIGGGASIIAGIQGEVVGVRGWITARDFIELFAISRAAPGLGTMLATLVGWKVAGWSGAIVASLALFLPSSLLCYTVFRLSNVHREKPWHRAMRDGLAPVGTGLVIAGIIAIFRVSDDILSSVLIAAAAALLLIRWPILPALAVIAGGGFISVAIVLSTARQKEIFASTISLITAIAGSSTLLM